MCAHEVVAAQRLCLGEEDPKADLDKVFVVIEPTDCMAVKRDIASSAPEESEDQPEMGMKLAEVDITCEGGAVETSTYDGGAIATRGQE
jgi:hypothetical protein